MVFWYRTIRNKTIFFISVKIVAALSAMPPPWSLVFLEMISPRSLFLRWTLCHALVSLFFRFFWRLLSFSFLSYCAWVIFLTPSYLPQIRTGYKKGYWVYILIKKGGWQRIAPFPVLRENPFLSSACFLFGARFYKLHRKLLPALSSSLCDCSRAGLFCHAHEKSMFSQSFLSFWFVYFWHVGYFYYIVSYPSIIRGKGDKSQQKRVFSV